MDSPSFLAFVKARLTELGPSRFEEVAKESGVPLSTIRKVHYGEVDDPRISTIQALHDYFVLSAATSEPAKAA